MISFPRICLPLLLLLAPLAGATEDKLQVVATIPDLADLAEAIGGDHVSVATLARANQNLHAVRVKPSHLVAVSRADLFVQVGLSLEHAWVPGLLQTARNRDVLPGQPGFVDASVGFEPIEVPLRTDRSLSADVHPRGNPHINLSFEGGAHMAQRILEGLIRVDPAHRGDYEANHAAWLEDYGAALERWRIVAEAVEKRDGYACMYHSEFDYLLIALGVEITVFLEPRPGLVPTPKHLAHVVETVRRYDIPVVLTAPWSNNKNVDRVAELTGAAPLELAIMVDGEAGRTSWIGLIDDCVDRVARAYGVDPEEVVRTAEAAARKAAAKGADTNGADGR